MGLPLSPFGDEDTARQTHQGTLISPGLCHLLRSHVLKRMPHYGVADSVPLRGRKFANKDLTMARILSPGFCHVFYHVLKRMGQHGLAILSGPGRRMMTKGTAPIATRERRPLHSSSCTEEEGPGSLC